MRALMRRWLRRTVTVTVTALPPVTHEESHELERAKTRVEDLERRMAGVASNGQASDWPAAAVRGPVRRRGMN